MPASVNQERQNPRAELEALIQHGAIAEAAVFASGLHAGGTMNTELALWLLQQARTWHTLGFLAEQKCICELALHYAPEHFEAMHLLGFHAQTEGDYALAEKLYSGALAGKAGYAFSALALGQMRMMRTGFREGREAYEARFEAVTEANGPDWRSLPIARWRGEFLAGKRLYLWAEQGLGDIVMFCGFLPRLLSEHPARVAFGVFPKLIPFLARAFPQIDVEPIDLAGQHALAPMALAVLPKIKELAQFGSVPFPLKPLQAAHDYAQQHGTFDYAAPLGDLLVHYMPGFVPAENQASYLVPDASRLAGLRATLNALGPGRRVGISWHTQNMREATRKIPLAEWLPLLSVADCHFISLQHQVPAEEIEQFCRTHDCKIHVEDTIDLTQDTEGLVALIAAMDEVITIDNSNVHLAGALGVPATLLLSKGCNYRWPVRRDEGTFWYKSVKTLRQQTLYDWKPVMKSCASALKKRVNF